VQSCAVSSTLFASNSICLMLSPNFRRWRAIALLACGVASRKEVEAHAIWNSCSNSLASWVGRQHR